MSRGDDHRLDYEAVRSYWEEAAQQAESASYMAHEQGLPRDCVEHRFALERAVVDRWFAGLGPTAGAPERAWLHGESRGATSSIAVGAEPSSSQAPSEWRSSRPLRSSEPMAVVTEGRRAPTRCAIAL